MTERSEKSDAIRVRREAKRCETCGHVRTVKVVTWYDGTRWARLCTACTYAERARHYQREAERFEELARGAYFRQSKRAQRAWCRKAAS